MGDEVICPTLERCGGQRVAGAAPKLPHHHPPSRREVVGGARHKGAAKGVGQNLSLGWYLPDVVADPFVWLESRIGVTFAGVEYLPDDDQVSPEAEDVDDLHLSADRAAGSER